MARALNLKFFRWLIEDPLGLLETISKYDCLSIHFSEGKSLKVYFRGFLILTVSDKIMMDCRVNFKVLAKQYYQNESDNHRIQEIINDKVNVANLQNYIDCVIGFLSRINNTRVEESVRQEISRINNKSREAQDTDFFVVDEEYKISNSKFDLVTLKWPSKGEIRKRFNSSSEELEIVVFELKQGLNAVGGSIKSVSSRADLVKHNADFYTLFSDEKVLTEFKLDIIKMFVQQACLKGFFNEKGIKGLKHVRALVDDLDSEKEIRKIAEKVSVKIGFILSDYKKKSSRLREQVLSIPEDFIFATASFMGYGLYEDAMLNRDELLKMLE